MSQNINNLRVKAFSKISSPAEVEKEIPLTENAIQTIQKSREELQNILDGKDKRKVVVVGPCSIHHPDEALEYAKRLNKLRIEQEDKLLIIMRAYFEKPRTTVGWKGFVYDPFLDNSYSLGKGVREARKLLVQINDMGLPTGTEVLGPIVIQYYSDLISWAAIGARTTESQTHRELASGLSMPVGFKNGTEGNIDVAINAIISAKSQHHFLGMDEAGHVSIVETTGNPYGHIILRGGKNGPNYSPKDIAEVVNECEKAKVKPNIFIDCSHANSNKDYRNQAKVWQETWQQINAGENHITGLMLESNLNEGGQSIGGGFGEIKPGVSVTDSCIGWEETERLLKM